MTPQLRTTEEAAEILRYRPQTLREWRRSHRGPTFVRIGRNIRYADADLTAFQERHRCNPEQPL